MLEVATPLASHHVAVNPVDLRSESVPKPGMSHSLLNVGLKSSLLLDVTRDLLAARADRDHDVGIGRALPHHIRGAIVRIGR